MVDKPSLTERGPKAGDPDPTIQQRAALGTRIHVRDSRECVPIQVGEHYIVKDGPLATTWYCAEVSRIERNWMEVNYYTTITPSLEDYASASRQSRIARLKDATFLRTWVLRRSGGLPTTVSPSSDRDRVERLWKGRIPTEHLNDHILVRDIVVTLAGYCVHSTVCNTLVKIRKILLTRYISFGLPRMEKVADSYNK